MKKVSTLLVMLMLGMSTTLTYAQTKTTQVVKTTKRSKHSKHSGTAAKHTEHKASSTKTVVGPKKADGTENVSYKASETSVKKTTPKN